MTRNVTLRIDETILRRARLSAVKKDQSLSQWLSSLILKNAEDEPGYAEARSRARGLANQGFHLGGTPLSREQIHER